MSRTRRVGALDLRDAINAVFVKYGQVVNSVLDESLEEVARESVEDLKAVTTWANQHPNSEYSKDWTYTIEPLKRWSRKIVVYNEDHYRLTHLLESGHSKWLWGRSTGQQVQGYPHIDPVRKKAEEHFERAVVKRIENINTSNL